MREKLAQLIHEEQWSGWMQYLFSKGVFNDNGTWTMPVWAVECWKRQMETPYIELSEIEQESDRLEADNFLAIIENRNCETCHFWDFVHPGTGKCLRHSRKEWKYDKIFIHVNGKSEDAFVMFTRNKFACNAYVEKIKEAK